MGTWFASPARAHADEQANEGIEVVGTTDGLEVANPVAAEEGQDQLVVDLGEGQGTQKLTSASEPDEADIRVLQKKVDTVREQGGIAYLDENGVEQVTGSYTFVMPGTNEFGNDECAFYVVDKLTELKGGIEVSGDVNLIVGERLIVNGSIHVSEGSTLHIYVMKGKADRALVSGTHYDPLIVNDGTTELHSATIGVGHVSHGVDNNGTLIVRGGEISDCSENGVFNEKGSVTKLLGGAIRNNKKGFSGEGKFYVAGTAVVEDNAKGNVVLNNNGRQPIWIDGTLKPGAHIGVTARYTGRFTFEYAKHNASDDPAKYFFSDTEGTATWDNEGEVVFKDFSNTIAYLDGKGQVGHVPADRCTELSSLGATPKLQNGWYIVSKDTVVNNRIEVEGSAHLILGDGAKLTAKGGIHVCLARGISVYCQEGKTGELYCDSSNNEDEAGIGGNDEEFGSLISIYGGKVTAKGGHDAAGIGGGCDADSGYIEIYGGEVTAIGGDNGAGIGAGDDGSGNNIDIYGGTITATGGDNGAGIGGGGDGKSGGTIQIYGGKITATGGVDAAGIGGGDLGHNDYTRICGGDITATGGENGAGIGGGDEGQGGTILISDGKVQVCHGDGAGIGGGEDASAGTTTISGGVITSRYEGEGNGAGIGGGHHGGAGGTITITGGDITTTSNHGAGIGGGRAEDAFGAAYAGKGGTISIMGGTVRATADHAYGMGTGDGSGDQDPVDMSWVEYAGDITVGGTANVTAMGYKAGIGGKDGTLTIDGGSVVARGGSKERGSCGISYSYSQPGGNSWVPISAGTVDVRGGTLLAETFAEESANGIDCAFLIVEGGQAIVGSIDTCVTAKVTVKGEGSELRVNSSKAEAVEVSSHNGNPHIVVEDGAMFESCSAKLKEPLLNKVGQGLVCKAGPTEETATERTANAKGLTETDTDCRYVHIGPAGK